MPNQPLEPTAGGSCPANVERFVCPPRLSGKALDFRMDAWIPVVAFAIQALVVGGFVFAWLSARRHGAAAASEVDPTRCYRQTGGARLDLFNASIPFATIAVTPSCITLSCFTKSHVFDRSSVRSLSRYRGLFSTGLRIQHSKKSEPTFVVFWTTSFPRLASALGRLGWVVSE